MLTKEQEIVLKYLLELLEKSKSSIPNQIMLGIGQYDFCGQSPKTNLSILFTLEELGYIKIKFMGHPCEDSPCRITLLSEAINYEFYEKEDKKDGFISSLHDIVLLIIGGVITIIVEIIISHIT